MKALPASALCTSLLIAALCLLASCASWLQPASALTPRSEAVCDQAPPTPLPPIPPTDPEFSAWARILIGLYEWEVDKATIERPCRAAVRAENAAAAERARDR